MVHYWPYYFRADTKMGCIQFQYFRWSSVMEYYIFLAPWKTLLLCEQEGHFPVASEESSGFWGAPAHCWPTGWWVDTLPPNATYWHLIEVMSVCWLHYLVILWFLGKVLWFKADFTIEFCPQTRGLQHNIPNMLISLSCHISMWQHTSSLLDNPSSSLTDAMVGLGNPICEQKSFGSQFEEVLRVLE